MRVTTCLAALALTCLAPLAHAETPQGAVQSLDAWLDRFEGIDPGYGVVVVTADEVLLNRTDGIRHTATGAPFTPDTPIYIASQTKAFMGLLAARLDAQGILSLDSTIADHWPGLELPGGLDAADWTLRDLITHQVPISVDVLTFLEAYAMRVEPDLYPVLISNFGSAREPGFDYDNLGYNIYGAILESATGRAWQDWLAEDIFQPLGLDHTSARTSDFSLDTLSWNHIWTGGETGWADVPPKTDGMMQSAGGMVTSTTDMAHWLQLQLRGEGPAGSGLTADMVTTAQTSFVDTHQEDGRNAIELPCSGYALGWNVCDFEGHALYVHGGGYTGARTMMAFSPDLGVGIASFSNSDNMTGWLTSRTVIMYLQFLIEHEDAERWADIRVEQYPPRIDWLLNRRREALDEFRAEARWDGWAWTPPADALAAYEGVYSAGLDGVAFRVGLEDRALVAHLGDYRLTLEPGRPDLFAGWNNPGSVPDPIEFERDASGQVQALTYEGIRFARTGGADR
ncbi:serine hydrolase domain-containing protein [Maricaulis alexandrii]|uniref:serine hydrolase domain-containing protein n=1 Tax=Maricaulis alexandrii TaxID=2570354 RepID=UPI001107B17B|nr:serine hydrolase domain-containing protein [Maricaulis alexandrii]